jgi:hypothetical protein
MATEQEVDNFIFAAVKPVLVNGQLQRTLAKKVTEPNVSEEDGYYILKTQTPVNPRDVLESFIKEFELDRENVRSIGIQAEGLAQQFNGLNLLTWIQKASMIPSHLTVNQKPLRFKGKEYTIKDDEASKKILDENISPIQQSTFGNTIDQLRLASGQSIDEYNDEKEAEAIKNSPTLRKLKADIDFLAQPVKTSKGEVETKAAVNVKNYLIVKTGSKINPRSTLEYIIRKYGLDSKKLRDYTLESLSNDPSIKHMGVPLVLWSMLMQQIPIMYTVDQLPLIIGGKEVEIRDNEASQKVIKDLEAKQTPPTTFGQQLDYLRAMSGEEPATNNMIARIGLGVLCVGGIALLVHHARKSIS